MDWGVEERRVDLDGRTDCASADDTKRERQTLLAGLAGEAGASQSVRYR